MAEIVVMPKAGNSVESCVILEWAKQEGDAVAIGDILCEAETDKATVSVESTAEGLLLKQLYQVDDDVPVMQPLAIVGSAGEDIAGLLQETGTDADSPGTPGGVAEPDDSPPPETTAPAALPPSAAAALPSGDPFASPRARNLAAAKGVPLSSLAGTGPAGRIIERDILSALEGQPLLTPAAREELVKSGMAVPSKGTGLGGRVLTSDLLEKGVPESSGAASAGRAQQPDFPGPVETLPVKGIRKITASRMLDSLGQTAQLSMHRSADATRLLALRKRLKESPPEMGLQDITINDLVMLATAKTLKDFPAMNAHWLGDRREQFRHVHLGCAVDTPRGLMVPVIRFADTLSLKQLGEQSKGIIRRCLDGQAGPEDLSGGTFTITNLGALGIESFTPVLNTPEVAILGVCGIQPKAVMTGEEVAFRPHIGLSLTFDHQAVDGAPAGRFLQALAGNLENIDLLTAL